MRIHVNIVYLWWTCVFEDMKGDDMLFDELKCDDVLCENLWNYVNMCKLMWMWCKWIKCDLMMVMKCEDYDFNSLMKW